MAGVIAVGDGTRITEAHVRWAHQYVDWCVRNFVRKLTPKLAEGAFAKLVNKALEVIRDAKNYSGDKTYARFCKRGFMPTGKLSKVLNVDSKMKASLVDFLVETQQIKVGKQDAITVFWVPKN